MTSKAVFRTGSASYLARVFAADSIAEVLRKNNGVGPGFDLLRLFLAVAVVVVHSVHLAAGYNLSRDDYSPMMQVIIFDVIENFWYVLPSFFALSGFLVMGSLIRTNNIRTFLTFRALRLGPALTVEICLSAFILGPIVTSFTIERYFSNPLLLGYFTNLLGYIKFHLPGVFLENPISGIVNGSLWTVTSEMFCYALLSLLLLTGLVRRRVFLAFAFVALAGAECMLSASGYRVPYTTQIVHSPEMLVLSFVCGGLFYLWQDKIPMKWEIFVFSVGAAAVVTMYYPSWIILLGSISATYCTVFLGLTEFPKITVVMTGDYSYGVYVYAYPIQQTIIWLFPESRIFYYNILISLPLIFVFAVFSWHCIEKPALSLRARLAPKAAIVR